MIDTHAHLSHRQFDRDREDVLARAFGAGMELIVEVGFDVVSSRAAVSLCRDRSSIVGSVGIHPHDSDKATPDGLKEIESLSQDASVVAIGETGLDFFRNFSPRDTQEKLFGQHIKMSQKANKPLIMHSRASAQRVLEILLEETRDGSILGVLHCFSGDESSLGKGLELGLYFGVGSSLTYSGEKSHELVRRIPIDKVLVETDSPYLSPAPFRGKRNEPVYLRFVVEKLSEILNMPVPEIERKTSANAKTLFLGG
ncbi:MAG: TatD family hydrolase [Candidatus Eisenbacteria bacterium]|nr:TatD family hydrolase [Candidatus Eisenbacteria bacterium]